jgi:t-SNARE complex subunit (syntaxin)
MEPSIQQQLDEQTAKLDLVIASVKKTERYLKLTFWITIILIVLPLVGMVFVIPPLMDSYMSSLNVLL